MAKLCASAGFIILYFMKQYMNLLLFVQTTPHYLCRKVSAPYNISDISHRYSLK